MTETLFESATEIAALLRAGRLSARELAGLVLDRVDAVNPALNAVVEIHREAALRAADDADVALARCERVGPLHGVPMTIKESFQASGMHSTWGDPEFSGFVADRDAVVVSRLRSAGAVLFGTTNVAQMLADVVECANPLYGRTVNPWDSTRSPGGSTGGGAAALAAGLTFLEYGSDLAGSIRIPAAFCGVYGLKPTAGTVPLGGFQPPGPPAGPSDLAYLSAVGPLARSAADLRTALSVTAGPDGQDAKAYRWQLAPSRRTRLADFRVGVVLDHPAAAVTAEVGAALSNAVDALDAAGAKIVTGWPDGVDPVRQADSFGFQVRQFLAFHGGDPDFATAAAMVEQHRLRMAARTAWDRYFSEVDVLLCPATCTAALPHLGPDDERPYHELGFWIAPASLAGLPALSAPAGRTPGGLPVGVQIVGPRHEDDTVITFAELAAEVVGGFTAPPVSG
ncbi:amidase family protein [Amycolatopsis saalfeldensis]|uniref:Amidase n=1 Tax=Amycolatopsis saalfeldensis TaxID=394193 RepID=A0A1H8Y5F8_9PSEU|nr:amidase family protein [Amycolatopsis saalfeldensis]SEP47316.1 amidase [Amycolatopsis saalfeldensis]